MNEFCAKERTPKANKPYRTDERIKSALRVPTASTANRGRLGCPARNPGRAIDTPKARASHFNHGKRRSNGDCVGNTAKTDRRADPASPKKSHRMPARMP